MRSKYCYCVGQDSVDCIATRYWLDGPGIEYQRSRGFPQPTRPAKGPVTFLFKGYQVFARTETAGK